MRSKGATWTSSSGKIIERSSARPPAFFWVRIAVIAAILFASVVGIRRWIHHAQLELVPVLVPPFSDTSAIVSPRAGAIVGRMARDVRDVLTHPARPRLAVLTFDDGPYPVETPSLVTELASLHAPADFFFIGDDARRQPAIAARVAASGFEIGNHTLTHPDMTSLAYDAQVREIDGGVLAIHGSANRCCRYFRPPHGKYDDQTLRAASSANETVALWDVDPGDWRTLSPDEIADSTIGQARAPAVILLHNGKDATILALPRIVDAYRRAGFVFITLSELQRRVPLDDINDPMRVRL